MAEISQHTLEADGDMLGIELRRPFRRIKREDFLWQIRTEQEGVHRTEAYVNGVMFPYSPSTRDVNCPPAMGVDDFHDTCNKSVSLYIPPCRRSVLLHTVLHNYIYRRWFQPYRSEIEHQRYLCKFISPRDVPDELCLSQASIQSIVTLHGAMCSETEAQRYNYEQQRYYHYESHAEMTKLPARPDLHILQPLFKALILIFCSEVYYGEDSTEIGSLPVHLVRTGKERGLSGPVSFLPIAAKIDSYLGPGQNAVRTTLETAIDFAIDLEKREREAFGLSPDPWCPKAWTMDWWGTPEGTGPLIGPSSWFVNTVDTPVWSGDGLDVDDMMATMERQEFQKCT